MKNITLLALTLICCAQLSAQTPVTKKELIGKWKINSVEMPGMMYYEIAKDSIALGPTLKAQLPDTSQLPAILTMIKGQMGMFKDFMFVFKADGTGTMPAGPGMGNEPISWLVDETASTIITTDKNKKTETLKAQVVNSDIRISVSQPQGEILLLMKKEKE